MIRTQVQLTEEQARVLKAEARREQRSMADLVRESVSEYLIKRGVKDPKQLVDDARELAGRYDSGVEHLGERHDEYLDQAYDASEDRPATNSAGE